MRAAQAVAGRQTDSMSAFHEDEHVIVVHLLAPGDAANEQAFVRGLTPETRYRRFQQAITDLTPAMLRRLLDNDGEQPMACVATVAIGGVEQEVGVARYAVDADERTAEFAIVVSDEWSRRGVGTRLMQQLIAHARGRGLRELRGFLRAENDAMLELMRHQGFRLLREAGEPGVLIASLALRDD